MPKFAYVVWQLFLDMPILVFHHPCHLLQMDLVFNRNTQNTFADLFKFIVCDQLVTTLLELYQVNNTDC